MSLSHVNKGHFIQSPTDFLDTVPWGEEKKALREKVAELKNQEKAIKYLKVLICNGATVRQADISATIAKEKKTHKQFQLKIQASVQKLSVAASRRTIRRYFKKGGAAQRRCQEKRHLCANTTNLPTSDMPNGT